MVFMSVTMPDALIITLGNVQVQVHTFNVSILFLFVWLIHYSLVLPFENISYLHLLMLLKRSIER